ncbi:hypothetical protein GGR57DRAFT_434943 [Xylariaceae sp. FL1272]|nr:hypothetical protein GGR57DRAFT_434943 [Xylariaceae sp. FL1272]
MQFLLKAATAAVVIGSAVAAPGAGKSGGRVIKASTTSKHGHVIDWVTPESMTQDGKAPATPPQPPKNMRKRDPSKPSFRELAAKDPANQGPAGTVPVLRFNNTATPIVKSRPTADTGKAKRDGDQGTHWYASSAQYVNNNGGIATVSLFAPYVESSSDFSLLQTAIVHNNAQAAAGTVTQTAEAGWIVYPDQVSQPHLFSYYTTTGYQSEGDNIGCWNTGCSGYVQTDSTIYPGIAYTPLSTDGGDQYELQIGYFLSDGNWWLWVDDGYVGYYPASLWSNGASNAGETLGAYANEINWYGEIYNSEVTTTTTDMGSGEFPSAGFGKAAYMHNIQYVDQSNTYQNYDGSAGSVVSDSSRYDYAPTWNSGTSWGSYFYVGGPGAGGQIGA